MQNIFSDVISKGGGFIDYKGFRIVNYYCYFGAFTFWLVQCRRPASGMREAILEEANAQGGYAELCWLSLFESCELPHMHKWGTLQLLNKRYIKYLHIQGSAYPYVPEIVSKSL